MLSWPWRDKVCCVVVIVSIETTVVGDPSLVRGRRSALPRVIVSCDGRDLRVWMSIPEIDRIDS